MLGSFPLKGIEITQKNIRDSALYFKVHPLNLQEKISSFSSYHFLIVFVESEAFRLQKRKKAQTLLPGPWIYLLYLNLGVLRRTATS